MEQPFEITEFVTHLSRLIQYDTSNPPGNEKPAALYLENLLKEEGIATTLFEPTPGRGNLVARLRAESSLPEKPLILLSHLDVVAGDAEGWRYPPFSGEVAEGCVWGRGALDMKSMVVLEFLTFLRIAREGLPLKRDLVLMALSDEENHGKWGAEWMFRYHPEWCEADFVLNEGGQAIQLRERDLFTCQHAEKGVLWLELSAEGEGAHGSIPSEDQATLRMLEMLQAVEAFARKLGIEKIPSSLPDREILTYLRGAGSFFERTYSLSPRCSTA